MIMDDRIHAPQIRFSGFSDDWEQRKFIDIVERLNKTEDNVKLPRIEFEDIVSGEGRLNKDLNTKKDDRKGIFFDENNILYGKLRPYLRKWYYARFAGVAIGDFWVLKIINNNHPLFIYYLIQTEKYQRVANDTSGTKMPRSDWKKVSESLFYIPNINEQKKISTIFNIIDNLITLHQCKLDKLINIKKSMLEKMFVEKNTDVPEIRFKGFTDTWEQRKLGEITERVKGNDGRMDLPTLTISASEGWLDQRKRFSSNIAGKEQKNYTLLKKGQLSYNHGNSKLAKYGVVYSLKNYEEALVPRVYHSFTVNSSINSDFIELVFATKLPDRELGKLVTSGARMDGLLNINYDDFMGIVITIPKIDEQKRIRNLFNMINKLITLHQRKLEKLKNIKTSCLEKMFV